MLKFLQIVEPVVNLIVNIPPICRNLLLVSLTVLLLFNGSCAYYLTHTSSENTTETLDRLSDEDIPPEGVLDESSKYYRKQGGLLFEIANLYK